MTDSIEKIHAFWQTLDDKQQLYTMFSAPIVIVVLLILLVYLPLATENHRLSSQFLIQQSITQKLISVQHLPTHFVTIKRQKLKSTIADIAKQKGLNLTLSLQEDKRLLLAAKDQPFQALRDMLLLLRNQYAITTTKANLTKTKDGFVNADLTLSAP